MRLEDIKSIRKKLGITQKALSQLSGVSQSAIAKIEAGRMRPSFEIAQAVFDAVEGVEHEESVKATDILNKKVFTVKASDTVEHAINLMKKHGISQIPVFEKKHLVGLISEGTILGKIGEQNLGKTEVREIMAAAPPTIAGGAPIKMISGILKYSPIVLVYQQAELVGVITKLDLLKGVK